MNRSLAVLITYYNERELLTQCLESLVGQYPAPEEILIYDDASEYPAANYVPSDLRARVIRGEKNIGPSRARNLLWQAARSQYVHFHDADDWFDSKWCMRVRKVLDAFSPDVVFTEVDSHRDGRPDGNRIIGLDRLREGGDLIKFCLHYAMLVPAGTYRRAIVETVGGYRPTLWQSEDYDFHIRIAARLPDYRLIFDPLVHIRLRNESRSQRHAEVWTCRLEALELLVSELPPLYRLELAEAASRVGSELFRLGERESARRAFGLASELGPPGFHHQQTFYRMIAKRLGPRTAEWVGAVYRNVLPNGVRKKIRANQK